MPTEREAIMAQARTRMTELERQAAAIREEARRNPQATQAVRTQLEQRVNALNTQVQNLQRLMTTAGDLRDLVSALAQGDGRGAAVVVAGAVTRTVIDHFIEKYSGGKIAEKEFFTFRASRGIPVYPMVNVEFGASVSLKGGVEVRRDANKLIGEAKLKGAINLDVALTFGLDLSPICTATVGGGIRGTGSVEGRSSITLEAADPNLSATLEPATVEVKVSASLFVSMPDVPGMGTLLESIAGVVGSDKVSADGNKLLYQLGSATLFKVFLPIYTLTFNVNSGSFSGSRQGSGAINVEVHPALRDKVRRLKEGMHQAVTNMLPSWMR